jgi:tetratricopeptide (TPR) repeat protein
MRKALLAGVAIAAAAIAAPAGAVTMYAVGSPSGACYDAAREQRGDNRSLQACTDSLSQELLTGPGRASTLVNRGIVYLNRGEVDRALMDFEAAIRADPTMAEGYTNRGLVLLRQENYQGAVTDISRGLELSPVEPEKAYYNRAVAYEEMRNIRAAYHDYRRAAELAPAWAVPSEELTRFRVQR